ncbi:hypothetical protein CBER1_03053 [Cercospora berteroae]|uniref:Cardiolipin synthase N-terminal domain-containing protein n=1 Tax=Cercospora berteroae TaxID=357750 RepID=A0A2S6CHK2_9PEZI|nr:hypothetical protein CBER1_03053 [Cercospora berteroae]
MALFSVFLQLCLAALTFAAPLENSELLHATKTDAWQYGTGGGIIGFIVLVIDIIIWVELFQSSRPVSHKLLWAIVVFFFPIIGAIVYFIFSNRQQHKAGGYEPIP